MCLERWLDLDEVERAIERIEHAINQQYPSIQNLCLESGALKALSLSARKAAHEAH